MPPLVIFGIQTLRDSPQTFAAMVGIVALAVVRVGMPDARLMEAAAAGLYELRRSSQ